MAPREALNSYPDHYLTTDYYEVTAPILDAGGDGGVVFGNDGFDDGFGHGTGLPETSAANFNGGEGVDASEALPTPTLINAAAARPIITPMSNHADNGSSSSAIENDPLSLSESTAGVPVSEGTSILYFQHSMSTPFTHHLNDVVHENPNMMTTIHQRHSHLSPIGPGSQYSPSSISIGNTSASATFLTADSGTSHNIHSVVSQQQQNRQDMGQHSQSTHIINNSSPSTQLGVPLRASSFGGFSSIATSNNSHSNIDNLSPVSELSEINYETPQRRENRNQHLRTVPILSVVTPSVSRLNSAVSPNALAVARRISDISTMSAATTIMDPPSSYRRSISSLSHSSHVQSTSYAHPSTLITSQVLDAGYTSNDECIQGGSTPSTPNNDLDSPFTPTGNTVIEVIQSPPSNDSPNGPSMSPEGLPVPFKETHIEKARNFQISPFLHNSKNDSIDNVIQSLDKYTAVYPLDMNEMEDAVQDLNATFATVSTTNESSVDPTEKYDESIVYDVAMCKGESKMSPNFPLTMQSPLEELSPLMMVDAPSTPDSGSMLLPRLSQFGRTDSNGSNSSTTGSSPGVITRAEAFELSPSLNHKVSDNPLSSCHTTLSFGPETSISDLTYYAERGAIVDVLMSLSDPHLKTLGTRMLADYAKMPHRRVAVASNPKILEFVQSTAMEIGLVGHHHGGQTKYSIEYQNKYLSRSWLGREYAVETVRSLTAAEENDRYLMNSPGLLQMLATVARGGPFVQKVRSRYLEEMWLSVPPPDQESQDCESSSEDKKIIGVASDKARLHACIAIMNLSCGKSNKVEITNVPQVLEAMRDVMRGRYFATPPKNSSSPPSMTSNVADEARLKATTCIKNLSNADANDAALLGTPGLVETLGLVAEATCHPETGATTCTTHACLALMNLSISKANKHRVFRNPGVMDALMAVIIHTVPRSSGNGDSTNSRGPSFEARVKACSALSNLAIGYDNKIPMFRYPGFVESILTVIRTDKGEARTKACSILWSFAAEMKNQVPVVQRGDILPALVSVAKEDTKTEARFKCVAALTLLAESPENAVPLLHSGSLEPLMNILQEAGPDPTQWRGQTASWCVGFLMNMAQCDDVVPALLSEGIVDLLAPLISLDHYQSLKAAMAVTFVCRYDTGDKTYHLLRQTENVIPKIVGLLHNTLSGRGGSGYKYGVFTLRSSVGCIASLASGPDFMKERIATGPVFESLLRVVTDFCVEGGTPGAIVGGGRDDTRSSTLAVRALSLLTGHLIPEPGCSAMPFGPLMDDQLITALRSFELCTHPGIDDKTRKMAHYARIRIEGGKNLQGVHKDSVSSDSCNNDDLIDDDGIGLSLASKCFPFTCGVNLHALPTSNSGDYVVSLTSRPVTIMSQNHDEDIVDNADDAASVASGSSNDANAVRTFLLTDSKSGRRFAVPCDPSGGRAFNDNRVWCFRRGRWCKIGEEPDTNFQWSDELQVAYTAALNEQGNSF